MCLVGVGGVGGGQGRGEEGSATGLTGIRKLEPRRVADDPKVDVSASPVRRVCGVGRQRVRLRQDEAQQPTAAHGQQHLMHETASICCVFESFAFEFVALLVLHSS